MEPYEPLRWEYGTKSPAHMHSGPSCFRSLLQTCTEVSATPKCDYPGCQIPEHLRMLLHSLRPLCLAPGGNGSIWKYLDTLVRSTRVSGRFACAFWTNLHFGEVGCQRWAFHASAANEWIFLSSPYGWWLWEFSAFAAESWVVSFCQWGANSRSWFQLLLG